MCTFFSASHAPVCKRDRKRGGEAHTGTPPAVMVIGREEPGTDAADDPDIFFNHAKLVR